MASARSEIQLEGYTIGRLLGAGAFGEVYAVENRITGKVHAAKKVPCQRPTRLLQEEIDILLRVSEGHPNLGHRPSIRSEEKKGHPNLLQILAFHHSSTHLWFLTDLMKHGNLEDAAGRLNRRVFKPAEATHIMLQLASGLRFMHEHRDRIVHRDLKMQNVLVDEVFEKAPHFYPEVKIADFGLSKVMATCDASFEVTSRVVGTPLYKPPEPELSPAQDLWSLGVLLFVMLMGRERSAGRGMFYRVKEDWQANPDYSERTRGSPQQAKFDALADSLPDNQSLRDAVRGLLKLYPRDRIALPDLETTLSQQYARPDLANMRQLLCPREFEQHDAIVAQRLQEEYDAIAAQHLQASHRRAGLAAQPSRRRTIPRAAVQIRGDMRGIASFVRDVRDIAQVGERVVRCLADPRSRPY